MRFLFSSECHLITIALLGAAAVREAEHAKKEPRAAAPAQLWRPIQPAMNCLPPCLALQFVFSMCVEMMSNRLGETMSSSKYFARKMLSVVIQAL